VSPKAETNASGPADAQAGRILLCRCRQAKVPGDPVRRAVEEHLRPRELAVDVVDDLCGLAARGDSLLKDLAGADGLWVVACHSRAVKWLFRFAGAPLDESRAHLLDTRTQSVEEVLGLLPAEPAGSARARGARGAGAGDEWIPWFPVIDYDRCTNCLKCLGFCLFGVYAKDAGERVVVERPANCKTNCPACARVCPEVAIIFPKYKGGPISGAEVTAEDMQREPAKVDLSKIAGGDVYAALRGRARGDKQADDADQAAPPSLKELQEELDIPSDVLRSLGGAPRGDET